LYKQGYTKIDLLELGFSKQAYNFALRDATIRRSLSQAMVLVRKHHPDNFKPSEETKKVLSDKLKIAHKENRHPGWSFINKNSSRRSYPEKYFYSVLKNNGLFERFTIIEKFPLGKYSLDFAIIDLKLDLEIDGQGHFRDEKAIKHDKTRDMFVIEQGWKVYRIAWTHFCNNKENEIKEFLNYIQNIQNETNRFYCIKEIKEEQLKKRMDKVLKSRKFGSRSDITRIYENKQKELIPLVLNSNINFSKHGWVVRVAKIIKLTSQNVRHWMKRFLPDFYRDKCFKRKIKVFKRAQNTGVA
jgi:very-short-patch-repair endonuclease